MNHLKRLVILIIVIVSLLTIATSFAAGQPAQTFYLTGYVQYVATEGGFYGIIGDDGKRYQPTNLPRKFRKDGMPVGFEARLRDDVASFIMWGTIIEIKKIDALKSVISNDERSAIHVLLKRMDAFNSKDLEKLQQFDTASRHLSKEQFNSWLDRYGNFRLRYVEIFSANSTTITGACFYTRELVNGMTLNGNIQLAPTTFTLTMTSDGWKLSESGTYMNGYELSQDEILAKAKSKYGVDDLANLWR